MKIRYLQPGDRFHFLPGRKHCENRHGWTFLKLEDGEALATECPPTFNLEDATCFDPDELVELERPPTRASPDLVVDKECEGLTAQWCPNCGDCTCPVHDTLHQEWNFGGDAKCPLHGLKSKHGDPWEIVRTLKRKLEAEQERADRLQARRDADRQR